MAPASRVYAAALRQTVRRCAADRLSSLLLDLVERDRVARLRVIAEFADDLAAACGWAPLAAEVTSEVERALAFSIRANTIPQPRNLVPIRAALRACPRLLARANLDAAAQLADFLGHYGDVRSLPTALDSALGAARAAISEVRDTEAAEALAAELDGFSG